MTSVSILLSILTLSMVILGVIGNFIEDNNAKQMIITIETVGVIQFAYFSLIGIGSLNPMFVSME